MIASGPTRTWLAAWKFEDPTGAARAGRLLRQAEKDRLVKLLDYAVVSWPEGADRPVTKHTHRTARGAGWGAFGGVLLGSLFLAPVLGAAAGAGIGAISRRAEGVGISREQLETIRAGITEGTSALFVITDEGDLDRLGERIRMHSTLVMSNLTEAERRTLVETFGGKDLTSPRG